ncbi:MAG: hypothetical protein IBJ03_19055 [Gemmatimonadaceae bacterium]|nr:hypothetical protein [Gemmatimonadaceae bacterium]
MSVAVRTLLLLMGVAGAVATRGEAQPPTPLDRWIVERYSGAQLLPDSMLTGSVSVARTASPPRIESAHRGLERDTLWAVHFAPGTELSGLAVGARTTLTGPTGTMTPVVARVVARRAFRAPRSPGAAFRPDSSWRHGWVYLVVMPHLTESSVARYRGWLLLDTPDAAQRR